MEHKQDQYIGSYWVGNCEVTVSFVWKSWSYDVGNEYCKREDYSQNGERWTHIFYGNPIAESEWENACKDLCSDCIRHNMD